MILKALKKVLILMERLVITFKLDYVLRPKVLPSTLKQKIYILKVKFPVPLFLNNCIQEDAIHNNLLSSAYKCVT